MDSTSQVAERNVDNIATGTERSSEERVGALVRMLRQRRGLSVRTLAARAGFSPSFVSQVERGQASPSIASMERIARALGESLGEFFARADAEPSVVVRRDERPAITSEWSRARIQALGPQGADRSVESVLVSLEPGGRSGMRPSGHGGDEFCFVVEGEVELTLGDTTHRLETGDAATFVAETPHGWENVGLVPARILLVTANAGK